MNDSESLFDQLQALQAGKPMRPVSEWQPERVAKIDMRIARDGNWYHEGRQIRRQAMVKLFASVLRKDADGFCLVTPSEKLLIEVEDAPFLAVDMEINRSGQSAEILFITNVDDYIRADAQHPLRVEDYNDELRPYIEVRDGLDALMTRSLFYRLVDVAVDEDREMVVYSGGQRFSLGRY